MATDAPKKDESLAELVNAAHRYTTPHEAGWISDAVIGVLAAAGIGIEYDDRFGVDLTEVIQPALELAAMRSPELANLFHSVQVDHEQRVAGTGTLDESVSSDCVNCDAMEPGLRMALRNKTTDMARMFTDAMNECARRGHLTCGTCAYTACRIEHAANKGDREMVSAFITDLNGHRADEHSTDIIPYSFDPSNHLDDRKTCTCACHTVKLTSCGACGWSAYPVNHDATRIEDL